MNKKILLWRNVWLQMLYCDIYLFIELEKLFLQQTFWPNGYVDRLVGDGDCRWSPTLSSTLSFAALFHAATFIRRYPLYSAAFAFVGLSCSSLLSFAALSLVASPLLLFEQDTLFAHPRSSTRCTHCTLFVVCTYKLHDELFVAKLLFKISIKFNWN